MKRNIYFALAFAMSTVLVGGFTSCSEIDAIDDLQGVFAVPTNVTVTGASLTEKTKEGNLRTFQLALTSQEGVAINMAFVSNQFYLTSNGYSGQNQAGAKNGNYITSLSSVNGSKISEGVFYLNQEDDNYTITSSILFTEDGKVYRVKGSFNMGFEPDDPTALTLKQSYNAMGQPCDFIDNGDGTYSVTFTTGGYTEEFDMTTYQTNYKGEGNDLQVVFNLPDGKLHEGVYKPGEGYKAGYTFMNNAYEAWGVPAFEDYAGTLWYTIANGAKVPSLVTTGDIVVTKNGPLYSILLDQGKGGVYVKFEGSLGGLDPDGGSSAPVVMMNSVLGVANYAQMGWIGLIDIQLGNGSLVGTYDEATYSTTYSGSGDFLQIEVYGEQGVGTLERGTYEIADDASFGPMKFKVGAVGMYGDGGTFVKPYTDGVAGDAKFITEGTLTIAGEGDDTKITLSTPDATYMFTGNIGL